MKRKALAAILTATLSLGMLTGCGSTGDTAGTGENAVAETTGEEEYYTDEDGNKYKKFDDVKLTFLYDWGGDYPTATDQYNNEVAKAIRDKIGVTVEFDCNMMAPEEKLNMMFASNDLPDIVNAPYWGGNDGCTLLVKKAGVEGRLTDLKDLVPNYPNIADCWDVGVISKKYLENDVDDPQFNGARYVIPEQLSAGEEDITNWAYGVFVRGDVPEALGIDEKSIKTADQLYDFMKKAQEYGFKDINGNDCIVATTFQDGWNYGDYTANFRDKKLTGYKLDENGNITLDTLGEGWVESNMFIWKLVNEGILDKECFAQSLDTANTKVGNGTALFTCGGYSYTIRATKQTGLYDSNPEMRYTWVGPMTYADGSPLTQLNSEGRSGSPAIFIPKTCSNVEAALTWLDYVNSKEGQKLVYYGFEGDTYELNEDGQPRMNAELTERYRSDSESVKKELRERGIGYIGNYTYIASKRTKWFGEAEPFMAEAAIPEEEAFKNAVPNEILPGYPIDAMAPGYEGYQEFSEWAFDANKQKEYVERAFFAETEEEARQILKDYQDYLATNNDGEMQKFLNYMTEQSKTRDDFVY